MSKANITPLVQNPQESIDRLQTLSQELQAKNSHVADNSLYYLNQTAIQNFILSFQELEGKEGAEEKEEQVIDSRTQTKKKLSQIELDFLHHLQQEKEDIALFKEAIITRNEGHKERLLSLREEVKNRIEEYSGEISPVAPYKSKIKEGETASLHRFKAQEIYKYSSEGIKNLTKDLIEESKTDLANAGITLGEDIKYVINCFGSLARDEASPYSDLEFGVLLEDNLSEEKLEETKQYFRNLTDLLNIKVINLGETTATIQDIKEVKDLSLKLPTKNGFSFDGSALGGCKTPLGNKRAIVKRIEEINQDKIRDIEFIKSNNSLSQTQKDERITEISETINQRISKLREDEYELIMTPSQMAQFHNEDWYRRDRHLSTVLYTTDILQASSFEDGKELLENYTNETNKILNKEIEIDELSEEEQERIAIELSQIAIEDDILPLTLRTKRAFALLKESIGKFEPRAGRDQDKGKSFSPKYDFYRPATMLIDHLSYLYDIGNKDGEKSIWERFDRLFVENSQRPAPVPLGTEGNPNIEGISNLKWMIDRTLQIRLKNYMAKDNQNEDMILLDEYEEKAREELEQKGLGIYEREVFEVYYVMMPFYNDVNRFNESKGKNTKEFSKKLYCDNSLFRKAVIHSLFLHYEESIKCHEQFIEEYKRNGQERHPNVEVSLNNMGNAYGELGDHKRQIELLNQSLEISKEIYGEKHPHVANNLNNLGNACGSNRDHKRQIALLNHSLEISKEVLGEKDPSVARSLHNIGAAYGELGNNKKQIELLNQSLEISKEVFGEKHPFVSGSLNNLGMAYGALGNNEKRIGLFKQSLEINKMVFGEKHPSVSGNLNNLGMTYGEIGDYKRQIELLNQSLEITKEFFGEKHPEVARTLYNLGNAYGELRDYKRQIELLNQSLKISKEVYGKKHPHVGAILNNLGNAHGELKDNKRKIDLLNQSLEIKKEFFGEKHQYVAKNLHNLGLCYFSFQNYPKAFELLENALIMFVGLYDENHPDVQLVRKDYFALQNTLTIYDLRNQGCWNYINALIEAKNGNIEELTKLLELSKSNFEEAISLGDCSSTNVEFANVLLKERELIGGDSNKNNEKIILLLEKVIALKDDQSGLSYYKEEIGAIPEELKEILQEELIKTNNESAMIEVRPVYLAYFLLIKMNLGQENDSQEVIINLLTQFREELEQDKAKGDVKEHAIEIGYKLYDNFKSLIQDQENEKELDEKEEPKKAIELSNQPINHPIPETPPTSTSAVNVQNITKENNADQERT